MLFLQYHTTVAEQRLLAILLFIIPTSEVNIVIILNNSVTVKYQTILPILKANSSLFLVIRAGMYHGKHALYLLFIA